MVQSAGMNMDLPNLVLDRGRFYVRVKTDGSTRKIRLLGPPGTPAFLDAYNAALSALHGGAQPSRRAAAPGSFGRNYTLTASGG